MHPESDRGTVATFLGMLRRYPARSTALVLLSLAAGIAEGIGVAALLPILAIATDVPGGEVPALATTIQDLLSGIGIMPTLGTLLALIVVGIAAKAALRLAAAWHAGAAAAMIARDFRVRLIRAMLHAEWGFYVQQSTGRLSNAVASEAGRASQVFTKGVEFVAALFTLIVYLGIAFAVSWQIAVLSILLGAGMVFALRRLVGVARRTGQEQTVLMRSLIARMTDMLYAIKPLKAMAREDSLHRVLERETQEINTAQRRQVLASSTVGVVYEPMITLFLAVIVYVFLAVLGFPFTELIFLALVFHRTVQKVSGLQKTYQGLAGVESALWSLEESIETAEQAAESTQHGTSPALRDSIRFERVTFGYTDEIKVLHEHDLTIPAGEFTAIIGPSGAGKTTIVDLVCGLYRPDAGEVFVDDLPLSRVDLRAWRSQIGYVPQEVVLFHDTVQANVAMHDGDVTRGDVEQALRDAGAWTFISELPQGLDTVIGEHGTRLSGGQRQRLSIARALVRRPALLVLDEATTALDPETEQAILRTLRDLHGQVTILAISHQPTLVEGADHVHRIELPRHGNASAATAASVPRTAS